LLFAWEIGITPLLAMTSRLNTQGRPFELHYFVRTRSCAAFHKELQSSPFAQQVIIHADDELGKSDSVATLLHWRYGRFPVPVHIECAEYK
jgi:vanillate O-demethylase ferredoxin subunit